MQVAIISKHPMWPQMPGHFTLFDFEKLLGGSPQIKSVDVSAPCTPAWSWQTSRQRSQRRRATHSVIRADIDTVTKKGNRGVKPALGDRGMNETSPR